MWARRLGVPHLWPSRVKVLFLGALTSVVIFSVFQYLYSANIEYLDLAKPTSLDIVCRLPRWECLLAQDPVRCTIDLEGRQFWRSLNLSSPCPDVPTSVEGQTCANPSVPLGFITGDVGRLRTVNGGAYNHFRLWSVLFLVLTLLLSFSILIHDLALLEEHQRPKILSIPNMKYATPCLWKWLSCVQCRRRMRALKKRSKCLWTCLVPVWTISQTLAFMVVMYPFSLFVSLVAPVRMSRIMVFLSSILCILWSIVFIVVTAVLDTQTYAVIWSPHDGSKNYHCVCLCEFPLSRSTSLRIVVLGMGVCFHSFNLAFRALRGLRRAQWANMFSVLYSVPIEAFPIVWERPPEVGGGCIEWRCEGEPVQSEPAFDPFCLMDEQPESASTRAQILPVSLSEHQQFLWEPYTGPCDTEIGCCGFPMPVDGSWEEWEERRSENDNGGIDSAPEASPSANGDVHSSASAAADARPPPRRQQERPQDTGIGGSSSLEPEVFGAKFKFEEESNDSL